MSIFWLITCIVLITVSERRRHGDVDRSIFILLRFVISLSRLNENDILIVRMSVCQEKKRAWHWSNFWKLADLIVASDFFSPVPLFHKWLARIFKKCLENSNYENHHQSLYWIFTIFARSRTVAWRTLKIFLEWLRDLYLISYLDFIF